ncbi:MAG: aspartate--tRNA ligase [Bacilli bacterium]|jgi:aspartyl-tRNA synthetase|nr:aspartate--tRNA ligase [Bacilli bacterium]
MERTDYNGELRLKDVGRKVVLVGWVATKRNLGAIQFIDLRDRTGIVQLTVNEGVKVPDVRNEYVLQVKGTVGKKLAPNPKILTGEIEVVVESIAVLSKAETTPFIIADATDALEDTRLAYRYLDLRRPILQKRLRIRAQIVKIAHEFLDEHGFMEVETPMLDLATPEGARDYLVPSRLHHGCFYALPQSPQLFKQLLMVGGIERYYQVARCFRDEDLRADRQPEFTQIDIEASFLDQEQILSMQEELIARWYKEILDYEVKLPLRRINYWDAMDAYGSDKPDTRYGLKLVDVTDTMKGTAFKGFAAARYVKGIRVPGYAKKLTRKEQDALQLTAPKFNLKGYMVLKREGGALVGSFAKFLDEGQSKALIAATGLENGDAFVFASSAYRRDIDFGLGAIRTQFAKEMGLIKPNTYDVLWVVNFPMFDKIEGTENGYTAEHHPFTRPRDEDLPLLDKDPEKVLAYAYDIIMNGYETGGGTLRIYDRDTQWKVFRLLGLSDEDVERKFGWFVNAFRYGVPPHGGLAYGLDRLAMIFAGTDNIRDVEAFPKNLQAADPMSHAPSAPSKEALELLGIDVKK